VFFTKQAKKPDVLSVVYKLFIVISHHNSLRDFRCIQHALGFVNKHDSPFCSHAIFMDIYYDIESQLFNLRSHKTLTPNGIIISSSSTEGRRMDLNDLAAMIEDQRAIVSSDDIFMFSEANLGQYAGHFVRSELYNCVAALKPRHLFLFTSTDECISDVERYFKHTHQDFALPSYIATALVATRSGFRNGLLNFVADYKQALMDTTVTKEPPKFCFCFRDTVADHYEADSHTQTLYLPGHIKKKNAQYAGVEQIERFYTFSMSSSFGS